MKDHSTMTTSEYWISILLKFIAGFIWYKNLLFRILPNRGTQESLNILFTMIFSSIIICSIVFRRWKTGWITTASVVLPVGLYTILAYATTSRMLIRAVIFTAAGISVAFSFLLLNIRVKKSDKRVRRRIYRNRLYRCAYSTVCISTVALLLLMAGIGWHGYFGTSLISASVKAEAASEEAGNAETITSNMDTLLKLQPEVWAQQSTRERIDVLQTVYNIEATYLGLSTPVTVEGDNLTPSTLGAYSDEIRLIQINLNHIEESPVDEVLETLLHEVHHCYEYRLAEAYNTASSEVKQLRLFRDAAYYAQEAENYINPRADYYGYISQHLEMDSETYAKLGVREYYDRISEWLEENAQTESYSK